ncbi:MAG: acyl-CoA dehydrogenase, partial [Comamonadaceae bacterium]
MSLRPTLDFLLYDWLDAPALSGRERFADHSRETYDAVLDTCERIAREKYAPFNRTVDTQEPRIDGDQVVLPAATHAARKAYADSGMLAAAQDYADGGMQLPYTVEAAANAFFAMASVSIGSNLLTTGNKMWISAGDHELTENIVHLVLAKIPGPDGALVAGTRGISLFIVPKRMVQVEAGTGGDVPVRVTLGERNDVALAGLNHKLGWRGTTNTLLNFGEGRYPVAGKAGAVGYLVGEAGKGLHCMFHMMNEARIAIGMAASMLGMAGYHASLEYARNRPQGRPVGPAGKDPAQPQVRIIEHADVKRMLLAQKAYCEGALALQLYCARLV